MTDSQSTIFIPSGQLRAEEETTTPKTVQEAQERIRQLLLQGRPIPVAPSGDVTGTTGEREAIRIQPGKLAALRTWFEKNPERLEAEKQIMARIFPQFQLLRLQDGRLAWSGKLRPNLMGKNGWDWHLLAVYSNVHPQAVMGGSVHVFLVEPRLEQLCQQMHWTPAHLIEDPQDGLYLCTTRAEDIMTHGEYETTAAQSLAWANKWLLALELVLAGKLSQEAFDRHGVI